MITSVALAYISANSSTGSIMKELSQEQAVETEQKSQEIEKIPMPATEEKQPVETEEQTENTPKQ
jgi:hypothetical protein